jgi:hypothetical protein
VKTTVFLAVIAAIITALLMRGPTPEQAAAEAKFEQESMRVRKERDAREALEQARAFPEKRNAIAEADKAREQPEEKITRFDEIGVAEWCRRVQVGWRKPGEDPALVLAECRRRGILTDDSATKRYEKAVNDLNRTIQQENARADRERQNYCDRLSQRAALDWSTSAARRYETYCTN